MEKKRVLWKKRIIRRQRNLEIRNSINSHHDFEVIKWYPNSLYGKEDQYYYDEVHNWYIPKNGWCTAIDPECFKNSECCVVLGWIDRDENGKLTRDFTEQAFKEEGLYELVLWFVGNADKFYKALGK